MISLDASSTTTRILQIALGGVPAAELAWVSNYGDNLADDINLLTQSGLTTNTTAIAIMDSPPADTDEYQLKTFHIKNQNAAQVTVIVQYNDNGTVREIYRVTLNQHDTLQYNQMQGWFVTDLYGGIKLTISASAEGIILAQVNPVAATLTDGYTVPAGRNSRDIAMSAIGRRFLHLLEFLLLPMVPLIIIYNILLLIYQ